MEIAKINELVGKHGGDHSAAIAILQDIQREEGYLSRSSLNELSGALDVPLSRLYSLATFYKSFSLKPTGRHRVGVCMGTACHVRGGQAILDQIERDLGARAGSTTPDRRFTIETVRCLGCCSIGPVVRVGEDTYGRVKQNRLAKMLAKYQ